MVGGAHLRYTESAYPQGGRPKVTGPTNKEFRAMTLKMIQELEKRMDEKMLFNKDSIKHNQSC